MQTVNSPVPPKKYERLFAEFTVYMIQAMSDQFGKTAIAGLNKATVEKFEDAQVGNYAAVFLKLAKQAKARLMEKFDDKRIEDVVKSVFGKIDKENQDKIYAAIEAAMGINMKVLVAKEAASQQIQALILETAQWAKKLRDETLESFTASTLRGMTLGNSLETIMSEFKTVTSTKKNAAKFVARNQVASFNGLVTKIRHQKIGIEEGIWVTSHDERVRKCHKMRDGKQFKLSEGLYSSCDGKTLLPGTDYQCRCTYKAIIPDFEEIEG